MVMTTQQENAILTQVGRGTPMGDLLRRYWWPVGISAHLKDKPTFIRVMGEDLVLFRDGKGRAGVLGAYCAHRRANLCLGDVETGGLRCRYHGWLYDTEGRVLQTPGEPPESKLKDGIRQLAYPVEELGGLVFAYLGPEPAPLLPRYDFLVGDGEFYVTVQGLQDCNWLQCVENGLDPVHPSFTHGGAWPDIRSTEPDLGFEETEWGLVYNAYRKADADKPGEFNYREHHLLMPGISCGGSGGRYLKGASGGTPVSAARWSVPIDDTHTLLMRVRFKPADNPGKYAATMDGCTMSRAVFSRRPESPRKAGSRTRFAIPPIRWKSWAVSSLPTWAPNPCRCCPGSTSWRVTASTMRSSRALPTATGSSASRTASIRFM